MEGNGEGMVAVVHGLQDAGLAVTLMSQGRKVAKVMGIKNKSLPHTKSSVETNTRSYDVIRSNAGVQICDDRYASSYQLAHCRFSPTSPPVSLSEFPPQRTKPDRTQGNFEIGGLWSGEVTSPIRTQYSFISSLRWADKKSALFGRASCQTDPFMHSLRRYPSFHPSRSISADLIERLIKHTQAKNLTTPSKLSKSMRSIQKEEQDEQTNRQENERSKNIQTYERKKNADRSNEGYARRERNYRLSLSGNRRHWKKKDSPINTTYDYLKGNSSLYRKRFERSTEVRYLDNLAKYIKDTLEQICDDQPMVCPRIQSRYNQHRKKFHDQSVESNESDDQAAPSGSQKSSVSGQVTPGSCQKDCPKGRKLCDYCRKPLACPCLKTPRTEAGTSSHLLPMKSKFCQCLPEDIETEKRNRSSVNGDGRCCCKLSESSNQKIGEVVSAWINELPVKAGDTPENVATREEMGKELANVLKNLPNDAKFDDNVRAEGKKYLDKLPIWLPDNEAAQNAFKNQMASNLLERLNKITENPNKFTDTVKQQRDDTDLPEIPNKFTDVIKKWVDDIDFVENVDKDKIAVDFINKLKPIALTRPTNNYEYAKKLKEAINDMLQELPVDTKGDTERTLNELTDKLIDKLISLPKDAVQPEHMVRPLNVFLSIINDWLDDEEFRDYPFLKNSKVVEDLAKKLHELQANNFDAEEMKNVIQDFLKNVVGIIDPGVCNKLTNKLLSKLIGDVSTPSENREEEVEKLYRDIYNWMKNRPEVSHLDPEIIKELSRELANQIYDNRLIGGEEINNPDWLKRRLGDIGEDETEQEIRRKRQLVLKEIDDFLGMAITDLPSETKDELKDKLADMLIKNVDEIIDYEVEDELLDYETDRLINKLFEGVKNIFVPDQSVVKIPKNTMKTLQEEIDNALANTSTNIKNKDVLKTNLIDALVDGILKGEDENKIKKAVYDKLRAVHLPEEEAKIITQKLLDKAKAMALAMKSQDSKMVHTVKISKTEPSSPKHQSDYQQKDSFVPDDVLKLNKNTRGSSSAEVAKDRRSTKKDGIDLGSRSKSTKQYDEPLSEELLEQLKIYNIDPNDKNTVARFKDKLHEAKQGKGPLNKLIDSVQRYTNLPKVPRKTKPRVSTLSDDSLSPTTYIKSEPDKELSHISDGRREKLNTIDGSGQDKNKDLNGKARDGKVSSIESLLDPKTKKEIKQSLKGGIHDILDKAKIEIDDTDDLETELNNLLNKLVVGDVDDVIDDVYKLLRDANIPVQQAKEITNKLLDKTQDISKVVAQKIKSETSKSMPLYPKIKQETKRTLNDAIRDVLDDVQAEIDDRVRLETKLNTLLNQQSVRNDDDVRDDVYRLLRNANVPEEESKIITNKLLGKAKDISGDVAKKTKAGSSTSRPLDFKTKQEINKILKGDIQKALDEVKTIIDDREGLESNLFNTITDQVEGGDVDNVRSDAYKLLRKANIPEEEARDVTNKLLGKATDLSAIIAQKTIAGSSTSRPLDSKTKQQIKQSMKSDIKNILDKIKPGIDVRDDLESNLLNTILDQIERDDVEGVRDDVYRLLRNANIPREEAENITNNLLGKAKDLSEDVAQKTIAGSSISRPLDSKTKQEIKKSMKGDIKNILDKIKTNIDDREGLESNLLKTILDQVERGDVDNIRDDAYKLLRKANIPEEEARDATNKLLGKAKELSKVVNQKRKAGSSTSRPFDSKTKKTLKDDIQKTIAKVKTKIDDIDGLGSDILHTILDQVERGDIEDVQGDVYKLLRNANIPTEQARDITNKILGNDKDLSEMVAQNKKTGSSTSRPIDTKTKQGIKQSLKGDINKALDKVKTNIDDREALESNLRNTIYDQVEAGDVDDVRDDVYRLLRNANIPTAQARDITNKILGNAKDLSEIVAQKTKTGSSTSRPIDTNTKHEIKQSLKGDIKKALDKVKTNIDDRESLESNLLNTIYDQVEAGDVEYVKDDVYRLLRSANIPTEPARDITNKILEKGNDLSEVVAQRIKSSSRSDYEDPLKPGIAFAQKLRPRDSTRDTYSKREEDNLRDSIIGDVSDVIEGAPLPLSSHTKNVLKAKLSNAFITGMTPPYRKEELKSKVLDILSEESFKLQNPKTDGKIVARRKDSTGRIKIRNESILQEISNALNEAPTRIPKSKNNYLKKKLAEIVLTNLASDISDVRMKIFDLLSKETNLHKGVVSDLSSDIIERIIYVLKDSEIATIRKAKKIIYTIQMERKKRAKLFPGATYYYDNLPGNYKKRGRRKKNDILTSEDDGPISRARSPARQDYSNLSRSISEYVDDTIDKEHMNISRYKIDEIKHTLEKISPNDILAMIRGDKAIKNKIQDILINEIKLKEKDANKLINGVINSLNEADDSQYSASPSQMQDMKGYLKGEILGLLEKYNVKFSQEGSLKSGSSYPVRGEAPFSSTPRDGIESPQMLNKPSLSTVYDDDFTLKTPDRINSGEYFNRVFDIVDNWVEELPVDLTDKSFREAIVKDLAADIIERKKYLQLNPDAKTSAQEELESLKYQVFRWMNNLFDVGDLTPMIPKIAELRDRINEIGSPMFSKSTKSHRDRRNSRRNGKERTSDAFLDKFEDWVDSLPMKFKNEEEKQKYEKLKSELFRKLKELGPNACPQAIENEINKFLRKAPLDQSKKIDLDGKVNELMRIVQSSDPSKVEASSFESKTGQKKLPNLFYDFIEQWCDSLPIDDSLDQNAINNIKYGLANKILQKICQLNLNPEILNDDFLYEDVLRDEIDNLLNEIRNYISIDDEQLAELKDHLVNKIKDAKQKAQNELAGQMYKQQLKDAISRSLTPGLDFSNEDQTSLEMLKDAVVDAFINLNYAYGNDEVSNKFKKKIADEVTKFCNNYLQRHPTAHLCSNKLNQDLYDILKSVSIPNDESMRSEVEHVRMKDVITDWVKSLPLAEQTPTGQATLNKMVTVLAKRLHDLESAGKLNNSDNTEEMKKEIKKWLHKLPLLGGKDSIDHYAADLMDRLKNTEDSRKFVASSRFQDSSDICPGPCHYDIKERSKPPIPCPDTCIFPPQFPGSLTREDREHLAKIRERVQQARSKLAKRPCRDASPSPCIDTGSQIDIRVDGSMKSIPSVCPGPFQRPYRSAASRLRETPSCQIPCGTPRPQNHVCPGTYASPQPRQGKRRAGGASPCVDSFSPCNGSYNEVQPQIPCRSPCDTYQGFQDPRSPCSRPSPTCRGQYSQPHTAPQSPQLSSSDQETRRPSTSKYYKEKVTRLGSLDDMRGPTMKEKPSDNFDWGSVRFPEEDDFWEPCHRPILLSDEDYGPFSRERDRKEERVRCRCRERVLSKCATKRRNRFCPSCNNSNNNDAPKRCAKCNPVQCPHPSYLYFRK